jgi:hypothetical protein
LQTSLSERWGLGRRKSIVGSSFRGIDGLYPPSLSLAVARRLKPSVSVESSLKVCYNFHVLRHSSSFVLKSSPAKVSDQEYPKGACPRNISISSLFFTHHEPSCAHIFFLLFIIGPSCAQIFFFLLHKGIYLDLHVSMIFLYFHNC